MINTTNEWQLRDGTGVIFPYYTHGALYDLDKMDLKGKRVFEYGVGASTLWYRSRGAVCHGAETSKEWAELVGGELTVTQEKEVYVNSIKNFHGLFDIVVVDGDPVEWRDECVSVAFAKLKRDGYLIFDNWMQPSLGWEPSINTQQRLKNHSTVYRQWNHTDWKTLIHKNVITNPWGL